MGSPCLGHNKEFAITVQEKQKSRFGIVQMKGSVSNIFYNNHLREMVLSNLLGREGCLKRKGSFYITKKKDYTYDYRIMNTCTENLFSCN